MVLFFVFGFISAKIFVTDSTIAFHYGNPNHAEETHFFSENIEKSEIFISKGTVLIGFYPSENYKIASKKQTLKTVTKPKSLIKNIQKKVKLPQYAVSVNNICIKESSEHFFWNTRISALNSGILISNISSKYNTGVLTSISFHSLFLDKESLKIDIDCCELKIFFITKNFFIRPPPTFLYI
ncbi:hypothetical protein [Chryseobacterium limigenitum]|nr:hypothetical protein [Chryseobacterium limigenitum]